MKSLLHHLSTQLWLTLNFASIVGKNVSAQNFELPVKSKSSTWIMKQLWTPSFVQRAKQGCSTLHSNWRASVTYSLKNQYQAFAPKRWPGKLRLMMYFWLYKETSTNFSCGTWRNASLISKAARVIPYALSPASSSQHPQVNKRNQVGCMWSSCRWIRVVALQGCKFPGDKSASTHPFSGLPLILQS